MGFAEEAVGLARAWVEAEASGREAVFPVSDPAFDRPCGAFVTLSLHPSGDLRGCIGFPMPVMPLGEAIQEAARSACHDPRFPDLLPEETGHITVEVTVLTVPEPIDHAGPSDLLSKVVVGRDGLIIDFMGRRGLLLPQVPEEWGWGTEEYLCHLAMKAGLPPDAWRAPGAVISAFRGDVYSEESPGGNILRRG